MLNTGRFIVVSLVIGAAAVFCCLPGIAQERFGSFICQQDHYATAFAKGILIDEKLVFRQTRSCGIF